VWPRLLPCATEAVTLRGQAGLVTGWSASLAVVPLYAAAMFNASPSELGTLYAVMAVLGVVGGPVGGSLADSLGRKPAALTGAAIVAAAFGALPFVQTQEAAVATMAAVGFGEAFLMSAAAALANDVTPSHLRGSQSALLNQCGDVTFMVMPITLTVVATYASYTSAFVCTASLLATASVGFALLARPPPLVSSSTAFRGPVGTPRHGDSGGGGGGGSSGGGGETVK